MKRKLKLFRVGRRTYFHHSNGIVVQKNRLQATFLAMTIMTAVSSGFFVAVEYALPALRQSSYFQNSKKIDAETVVSAEALPDTSVKDPIKQDDDALRDQIQRRIEGYPGNQNWAVFVYDLNSDKTVSINAEKEFDSASLYKLFLLEALEKKLPQDQWRKTKIDRLRISDCVQAMLKTTDDPCSEELGAYLDWKSVDDTNAKNGFPKTKLSGNDGRKTTAGEVGELLIRLKKGHILSDKTRRFVFDALYQQNYSKGIPLGCSNCRTANKSGELTGVSHDAGIVTHGPNSYVVVVMSQGGNFDQIADITKLIDSQYAN
ncbi:serine hydrolase [Candidatus Saccharibacteria bacterium]|nr:serine hydrolase [Candidatus Saccharibacteria bacterium]